VPSRIESPVNPKVKHLVRLRKSSRYRKETGLFFLEGKREIEAMLEGGRKLDEIFFPANIESKDELSSLRELSKGIPDFELTDAPMKKVSYRGEGTEIIGVARSWSLDLDNRIKDSSDLILILDEVEKPGNLGAILRTAEAMGVEAIVLTDSAVDFFNPNVIRSSMGLFASMPVFSCEKDKIVEWMKKIGFSLIGTSSKASKSIYEHKFPRKTAIVMGNESRGLGSFWEEHLKLMLSIPMNGKASSINLNCAAAVVLAEINRRKFASNRF
jgi:TrmH family RNA methyltransferase